METYRPISLSKNQTPVPTYTSTVNIPTTYILYSGIVYSQCMRLRRIINSQNRLESRLEELKQAFKEACYPTRMIENISKKVLNTERDLTPKQKEEDSDSGPLPIRVISTHGSDTELVTTVKKYETQL